MANFSFDANQVAPDEGRVGAIPAGWYPVSVDETEMKPTSSGGGSYLQVRFTILDGAYKNMKFWHRFNVQNASEKAVEIAFKQLSALLHAVKVLKMDRTEQIHNIPLFVKVKVTTEQGYEPRNDITAFREINDQAAKSGYQAQQAGGAVAAPKPAIPPAAVPPAAAAPGAAPAGWQAPATAQPWGNAPAQAAPAQQAPAAAPAPETAPQAQEASPSWANNIPAERQAAPAQQTTTAPSQESTVAQTQVNGEVLPPWMQGGQ